MAFRALAEEVQKSSEILMKIYVCSDSRLFPNESGRAKSLRGDFSSGPSQLRWGGSKATRSQVYRLTYMYSVRHFATTGAGCTPSWP